MRDDKYHLSFILEKSTNLTNIFPVIWIYDIILYKYMDGYKLEFKTKTLDFIYWIKKIDEAELS